MYPNPPHPIVIVSILSRGQTKALNPVSPNKPSMSRYSQQLSMCQMKQCKRALYIYMIHQQFYRHRHIDEFIVFMYNL